ncbi:MAG TPA: transglycosylase SLT domain-containing protein [Pyrinomonadaceae bacterium]|nr:transglycosylase SLT domain-containing protein [Acidobacteriota bacterium]HQZ94835.1 transglycosylase SLT domain-containing protein [Pyrinomonadaceae bacterium]
MKKSIYKVLSFTAFIFLVFGSVAKAQTPEVVAAQRAVNDVLDKAGTSFREGLLAYEDKKLPVAAEKFNKSVEAFLMSTLNIQREAKLQACYNQLIETVYRIEFPTESHLPQVRNLSLTCGWTNIDATLADRITAIARNSFNKPVSQPSTSTAAGINGPTLPAANQIGFNSQEFEPSPLDDLSKLQLTAEEQDVETNPVAQAQYQYIQYAVANKSLGFSFQVHPMIQQYINYYRGRGRQTMEIGLYRSGMFMRMARRIFKEEGIPENVAWLGQVESAWKPSAMSNMAASGLWQFIPGTGTRFGLQRTAYVDERNSFEEATRASARYLKFLYNRYGNWELGIAAYNCGEGNVDRAIRRAGVANFWLAYPYLPQETRNYVPNILATILIANNPGQYGFGHIRPAAPLTYDRVRVPASTNLALVAQAADTTVQYLRYLNPHLRTNSTPPTPYIINVPSNKANEVVAVFRRIPATQVNNANLANSSTGETWQNIANRTGVSVGDLMAANPGMSQPRGKVFVPVAGNNVQNTSYSRPTTQGTPVAAGVKVVKAKAGDTVQKVAERNNASPTEVAKFNGLLPNSVLGAGREIKIPSK